MPPRREAHGHGGHQAPEPQLPPGGTRVVPQKCSDVRARDVGPDRRNDGWSPGNVLEDTVAGMQRDMAEIRAENLLLRTPGVQPVVPTPRQAAFTLSHRGWPHLQGDALNMALLVPMTRQTSRKGLVDALSAHYGSPGRLADYRRQFEKTTRSAGDDPSIFAIALETLAVKVFGDMGQTARLRLIRDHFIAGHSSCELSRYLDSVPPETPMRNVVDRCRVWESHADPEIRRVSKPGPEPVYPAYVVGESDDGVDEVQVATINQPDQVEDLLRRLLTSMAPPVPVLAPVPMVEKLLQRLVVENQRRPPAPVIRDEPVGLEKLPRSYLSGQ